MHVTSFATKLACVAVCAALSATVPASAIGASTEVALVHQDHDGSFWYSDNDNPTYKHFITRMPCWVDHDHVRMGGWGNLGCAASRP